MTRLDVARIRKFLAGVAGAIVSAGGIAVLFPDLSAGWATLITGAVTALAVLGGPANTPKPPVAPPVAPVEQVF
ncbi:hypothetical protein [Amycolatopsis sp. H20-H5]|uniref:hypothetical protein n=1 Tax=Amycolatopsis sp. H20-H5 TaxID=3046309 RepID=UPI002DB9C6DC|nr:hypothetical protein [Amycolatopsis sp. H20-H5]MEC3977915.1 hypothetical protein [Amycolatopsis sp. H20-H5]